METSVLENRHPKTVLCQVLNQHVKFTSRVQDVVLAFELGKKVSDWISTVDRSALQASVHAVQLHCTYLQMQRYHNDWTASSRV
jgi:hypothetical protein